MWTGYFQMLLLMEHTAFMHKLLHMLNSGPTAMEKKGHSKSVLKNAMQLQIFYLLPMMQLFLVLMKIKLYLNWILQLLENCKI